MLKWLPLLVLATVGPFFWFVVAFFSDNNFDWYTSEFVQIARGVGTLLGVAATFALIVVAAWRWVQRRLRR
jgi:hypothetical protein